MSDAATAGEATGATGATVGVKHFLVSFRQKIVVDAASIEEMSVAAENFRDRVFPGHEVVIDEVSESDGKHVVRDEFIARVVEEVADLPTLKRKKAEVGEICKILGESGSGYMYQPKMTVENARDLDVRHVIQSLVEGFWVDIDYMRRMTEQAMRQQQAATRRQAPMPQQQAPTPMARRR